MWQALCDVLFVFVGQWSMPPTQNVSKYWLTILFIYIFLCTVSKLFTKCKNVCLWQSWQCNVPGPHLYFIKDFLGISPLDPRRNSCRCCFTYSITYNNPIEISPPIPFSFKLFNEIGINIIDVVLRQFACAACSVDAVSLATSASFIDGRPHLYWSLLIGHGICFSV